jgi:glutamine amidotransferase
MIAVVDYHKGNLKSVERGLRFVGGDARITDDPAAIRNASAIVLPGVGAYADAVATMAELGQDEALRERIAAGVPFMGICLGLHLLFDEGVEGAPAGSPAHGLGFARGVVERMPRLSADGAAFKVPHVGWNAVWPATPDGRHASKTAAEAAPASGEQCEPFACPLLANVKPGEYFYFTHSYIAPETPGTVAVATHSVTFPSAVQVSETAFGLQFHPEKSSDAGMLVLRNFVKFAERA